MLLSTARMLVILGIALAAMEPGGASAAQFTVGDRVECDAMQIGRWRQGTVSEVLKSGSYRIRFDDDRPGYAELICLPQRARAAVAPMPATARPR